MATKQLLSRPGLGDDVASCNFLILKFSWSEAKVTNIFMNYYPNALWFLLFSPLVPRILSLEMSRESLEMNAGQTDQSKEHTPCGQKFSRSCNIA